jgi:superfamily II DNA/RNA helicase
MPFRILDKKSEKRLLAQRRQSLIDRLQKAKEPRDVLEYTIMLMYQTVKQQVVAGSLLTGPILQALVKERKVPVDVGNALLRLSQSINSCNDGPSSNEETIELMEQVRACGLSKDAKYKISSSVPLNDDSQDNKKNASESSSAKSSRKGTSIQKSLHLQQGMSLFMLITVFLVPLQSSGGCTNAFLPQLSSTFEPHRTTLPTLLGGSHHGLQRRIHYQSRMHSSSISSDSNLSEVTFRERYNDVLPDWLLQKCEDCGWERPTLIQEKALDVILRDRRDAIVQAETGSGKTLAYLLPALAAVDGSRAAVQALIVVPTRELGLQCAQVAKRLAAASVQKKTEEESAFEEDVDVGGAGSPPTKNNRIMVMSVLQGSQNRRQRAWAWADPPHIVIGTPNELCDMVKYGGIKRYNSVKLVVVDEVDACLLNNAGSLTSNLSSSTLHELLSKRLSPTYDDGSSGTAKATESLIRGGSGGASTTTSSQGARPINEQRQTIFASATIPQPRHFLKQCIQNQWTLRDPVHVCLQSGEQLLPSTLEHAYMVCSSEEKKVVSLQRLLQKIYTVSLLQQSSHSNSTSTNPTTKKVLVFMDPHRPMEQIANVMATTVTSTPQKKKGMMIPAEEESSSSSSDKPEKNVVVQGGGAAAAAAAAATAAVTALPPIFSVLRYEDNLSKRADAIAAFRGVPTSRSGCSEEEEDETPSSSFSPSLRVLFSTDMVRVLLLWWWWELPSLLFSLFIKSVSHGPTFSIFLSL